MAKLPMRGEDAKRRGRKAYRDGVPIQACPERGLSDWQDWRAGWRDEEEKAAKKQKKQEKETK